MADHVEIRGANVLVQGLETLGAEALPALASAVFQEAERIMTEAKTQYVPVDTGVLRDSGFVSPPEIGGMEVSVTLGFGGAASAYALVQHERLDYTHTVGGPKYLERPVLNATNGMEDRLAETLAAALGGDTLVFGFPGPQLIVGGGQ